MTAETLFPFTTPSEVYAEHVATTLDREATRLYRLIAQILLAKRDATVTPILNTTTH